MMIEIMQDCINWLSTIPWSSIITALGGFVITIGGLSWNINRGKTKYLKYTLIIAGIITLVGAISSAIQTSKFEKIISEQSNTISNTITGGDSFCYLSINPNQAPPFSGKENYFALCLKTQGAQYLDR